MDISVILVSYNTEEMTKKALNCLFASTGNFEMEVLIIDNASKDNSAEMLCRDYPHVTLIENKKNVGFGRANNQALPLVKGRYVLLLNTDAFVETDTIAKTVLYMDEHLNCGILGVRLVGRDGVLQPSCRFFPTPWNIFLERTNFKQVFRNARMVDDMSWDHASVRNCDWVPGCYYLIRKELIDQVGLFDPRYFLYYEEVDHCFAAKRAGWEVVFFPGTTVVHIGGESAKKEGEISSKSRQIEALQIESEMLYFRKNHGISRVMQNAFLTTLADGILLMKDILKLRHLNALGRHLSHALLVWNMLMRTRFGKEATR